MPPPVRAPLNPGLVTEPAKGEGGAWQWGAREKYREKGAKKRERRVRRKWMRLKGVWEERDAGRKRGDERGTVPGLGPV